MRESAASNSDESSQSSASSSNHGNFDPGNAVAAAGVGETSRGDIELMEPPEMENDMSTPDPTTARSMVVSSDLWWTLAVSVALGLVSGSLYGFGRYSRALKAQLHLSQMQIQRCGILLDTGNYIGHPLTGYIYDKFGAPRSCYFAAVIVLFSYGSIHFVLLQDKSDILLWIMNLSFFGVGFGSGLGYIAALGSTTKSFLQYPAYSGRAVGMVAAGYGFCSTLVGITYHFLGLGYFFLFWAVAVALVNLVGARVFVPHNNIIAADSTPLADEEPPEIQEEQDDPDSGTIVDPDLQESLIPTVPMNAPHPSSNGQWTSWKRLDFWMLFLSFACITGCGIFVINNLSTMVQSVVTDSSDGRDNFTGILVYTLSICNVSGRVLAGLVADHFQNGSSSSSNNNNHYNYKLILLQGSVAIMTCGMLISALLTETLYPRLVLAATVCFTGVAYGSSWVLIVGLLDDFFGKANFGKDYGLVAMGPAVSGMILNSTSAWFYQQHANAETGICLGRQCYQTSFFLSSAVATTGWVLLVFLTRTHHHHPAPMNWL